MNTEHNLGRRGRTGLQILLDIALEIDLASEITKKTILVASFILSHSPTPNNDFVLAEVCWPCWNSLSQSCLVSEVQLWTGLTGYLFFPSV